MPWTSKRVIHSIYDQGHPVSRFSSSTLPFWIMFLFLSFCIIESCSSTGLESTVTSWLQKYDGAGILARLLFCLYGVSFNVKLFSQRLFVPLIFLFCTSVRNWNRYDFRVITPEPTYRYHINTFFLFKWSRRIYLSRYTSFWIYATVPPDINQIQRYILKI